MATQPHAQTAPPLDYTDNEGALMSVQAALLEAPTRQILDRAGVTAGIGKESIAIATPKFLKLSMIQKTDETGRSMITLHTENGDIFLSAPNGRIHFVSKYVSREVGAATSKSHLGRSK
jgi:hypothetical protein